MKKMESGIKTSRDLATELAFKAKRLKELALEELEREKGLSYDSRPLYNLFEVFNHYLASLDEEQFADSYAQTVTYGLFATRYMSKDLVGNSFVREDIGELLPSASPFLLDLFRRLINSPFDSTLLDQIDDIIDLLSGCDITELFQGEQDPVIHFYQDFLDAYDPKIRKSQGVYYTPDEVVSYIVRTTHSALQEKFGLPLGLADTTTWRDFAQRANIKIPEGIEGAEPFVQILDPATGTGTFLLRVIEVIHETMMARYEEEGLDEEASQREWIKYVRVCLLPRINGFELMMAPYIVSHLRLGLAFQQTGFVFESTDRLRIFLTNTLEMHTSTQLSWLGEHVAQDAERVKKDAPISVILGNPPYERESVDDGRHKGGWVRDGWAGWRNGRALLEDFNEPVRHIGAGGHLKNIYNLYVYFWRWALWRVFDRYNALGIVSFITPSSYLQGPGFAGMREEMRRAADTIYILDLEGDQRGTRTTDNVFHIKTPVCVGTLISSIPHTREAIASSKYCRVVGSRSEKLAKCAEWKFFDEINWANVDSSFQAPLLGSQVGFYEEWPFLTNVWPWQHSGVQYKRTWPIGESQSLLERRWRALLNADNRATAFRETGAWKISKSFSPLLLNEEQKPPIAQLSEMEPPPTLLNYGFRSFDRQWAFADKRLGDRLRPPLWQTYGESQIYLASLLTKVLGDGPAATVSAFVPDLDYFCGRGGKDVIPLWRDPEGTEPNLSSAMQIALASTMEKSIPAACMMAYTYAVLCNPGYVRRFKNELQIPGPRLPLTKNKALFERGVELGIEVLRWHTYGERFRTEDDDFELCGSTSIITPIPPSTDHYPERHKYHAKREVLQVGDGEIGPVSEAVWNFSVSGLQVVKSWLSYRMKKGAGRKSSPLDDIRPESWTSDMTQELLELLWVLEWTTQKYPELDAWLDEVLESELFAADEIPAPTDAERKEPKIQRSSGQCTLW